MNLGLAVPLFDEAVVARATMGALHAALAAEGLPFTLCLVDNGSTDGTGGILDELARRLAGVQVVHLRRNAGYGGGILAGMAALDTPLLGWCWGDGQIAPDVVVAAWRRLREGDVDLVKARRGRREDGLARLFTSRAYHGLAALHPGVRDPDINGCPKLFTRAAWERVGAVQTGWLLDLEVMSADLRVAQVEAVMRRRPGGRSHVRWATVAEFLTGMPRLARSR